MRIDSRSQDYCTLLELVLQGHFAEAGARASILSPVERDELESLIEFQKGHLRRPQFQSRALRALTWLVYANLWLVPLFFYMLPLLRGVLSNKKRYLEARRVLYPDLIHARYTSFEFGLISSLWLALLCLPAEAPAEAALFSGLVGHFLALHGRLDLALPILTRERERLYELFEGCKGQPSSILEWQRAVEMDSIEALHLIYAGHVRAGKTRYTRLLAELEAQGYFWLILFSRGMRQYASMELLDEDTLIEDSIGLKRMLGEIFEAKYGLRTSAYAGLLAALKGNLYLAQQQIVTSEANYNKTDAFIERGRYHFLRALTDLEMGETRSALSHAKRAEDYFVPMPGAGFYECESLLLSIEVLLRCESGSLQAEENNGDSHRSLRRNLRRAVNLVRGSTSIRAKAAFLRLYMSYLEGHRDQVLFEIEKLLPELEDVSPRFARLASNLLTSSKNAEALAPGADLQRTKLSLSVVGEILNISKSANVLDAGLQTLSSILGAEHSELRFIPDLKLETGFKIEEMGDGMIVLLQLPHRVVEMRFVRTLNHVIFDDHARTSFELALSVIQSIASLKEDADAQKNAELGKLASQVGHDIRSPLSALNMAIQLLDEVPEEKRALIRQATRRINDIASDLLERGRASKSGAQALLPKKTNLNQVVKAIVNEKRAQFRDRAKLKFEMSLSLERELASELIESDLSRALSNLINNSVEAIQEDGWIRVSLTAENGANVILVEDSGQGMSAELLARVGERGVTSKGNKPVRGSGLGLYQARRFATAAGGRLLIRSTVGVGTAVSLVLPEVKSAAPRVTELDLRNYREVVIVDDDASIAQAWQLKLSGLQMPMRAFSSVEEFIGAFDELAAKESFFLMDFELPPHPETGLELIKRFDLAERALLVTGRAHETQLQALCASFGVRLMAKDAISQLVVTGPVASVSADQTNSI